MVSDDAPIVHAETQAVHVEVQRPDGEHVYAPDPAPRGSLLKVRGHFLHELGALPNGG